MRSLLLVVLASFAAASEVGVVSNIVVLSDKVADVSSLAAWKKSFISDGMSDAEKALAIWRSVAMHQYQNEPPQEFVDNQDNVSDVIKLMNVYGYSFCGIAAGEILALSRSCGLEARACTINSHVVAEIFHDGGWHLYDASLINRFPKGDGQHASVTELCNEVSLWRKAHPELAEVGKLVEFMTADDGTRWRTRGPEILTRCPTISVMDRVGFYPANSHDWATGTMQEYAIDPATDTAEGGGFAARFRDQPYVTGHRMNLQLRRGERITRNWSNAGRHVNERGGNAPSCIGASTSAPVAVSGDPTDLRYSARLFGDLAPGRIGNGRHDYAPPLADGGFRLGALQADNLASASEAKGGAAVQVKDAAAPAVLVIRMPSSYVYLDGELTADAVVGAKGRIVVEFSDNHGLDWEPVGEATVTGALKLQLGDLVHRRYDYRLRFTFHGAGTGFDALAIGNLIQHSQRPLPALGAGDNVVTVGSGRAQGTVTLLGSMNTANAGKALVYTDFHPRDIDQIGARGPELAMLADNGTGSITFPIAAPGDIERLRVGVFYRCRAQSKPGVANWTFRASTDDGTTWHEVGVLGDTLGEKAWGTAANLAWEVPVELRGKRMLVRIDGRNHWGAMLIHNLRLDADYLEPEGGLAPVKVSYAWSEDGQAKSAERTVEQADERWTIRCGAKPTMTSITIER